MSEQILLKGNQVPVPAGVQKRPTKNCIGGGRVWGVSSPLLRTLMALLRFTVSY